MAYKFKCDKCGVDIITKYVKIGEMAKCRNCGEEVCVPANCVEVSNEDAKSIVIPIAEKQLFDREVQMDGVLKPTSGKDNISNKDFQIDTAYNFKVLLGYGKFLSGLGWLLIIIGIIGGIIIASLAGDFGVSLVLSGIMFGVVCAIFGIMFIVSGQIFCCFVSIERNTRSTYEILRVERGKSLKKNE